MGKLLAAYPDPDNFLRVCPHARFTRSHDETYMELVEEAAVIRLVYWQMRLLVKSWVKRFPISVINWQNK